MTGDEPGTDAEPAFVGVCMGKYDHPNRYQELPKAGDLLQKIADKFPGSQPIILNEPITDLPGRLASALPGDALDGRPLIVVWSGHGVEGNDSSLRLRCRLMKFPVTRQRARGTKPGNSHPASGATKTLTTSSASTFTANSSRRY